MKLIAQVKLNPTKEQAELLKQTLLSANKAAQHISDYAWMAKVFGQYDLHHATYHEVRSRFNLSAQMTVRAIAKVADAYKLDRKSKRTFRPLGSVAYDNRILSWKFDNQTVNIWTVDGRQRIPFVVGDRQMRMLQHIQGEADLVYRNEDYYLYQTCEIDEQDPNTPEEWLGVDLGIVNLATDSDGNVFTGEKIEATRKWYESRRAALQSVGTKSAKRRLRQLSGRQYRFQKDANHTIAKRIVELAKRTGRGIALEDLKGIRDRVRLRRKQRAQHSNWQFHQLRSFLEYKAKLVGVFLQLIDPRYTSQACSRCGHCEKANRPTRDNFRCVSCGYAAPADINAAANIAARAKVNWPMVPTALPSVA
ncbi:transposase-like protein [Virus Rctr71]|nr:transposase-like protein [Virus Rctr71]